MDILRFFEDESSHYDKRFPDGLVSYEDFISIHRHKLRKSPLPNRGFIMGMKSLPARVNYGRWIVDCPKCRSAQMASRETPFFHCAECDSGWFRVVYPPFKTALEMLLLKRPDETNRNWESNETLADVEAENASRGIN